MKKLLPLIFTPIFLFSNIAYSGVVESGVIKKLAISKSQPDMVFIEIEGAKTGSPTCHSNSSWTYVMPLISDTDKSLFSMLLAARATKEPVRLEGNNLCDTFSSIETLNYFTY